MLPQSAILLMAAQSPGQALCPHFVSHFVVLVLVLVLEESQGIEDEDEDDKVKDKVGAAP